MMQDNNDTQVMRALDYCAKTFHEDYFMLAHSHEVASLAHATVRQLQRPDPENAYNGLFYADVVYAAGLLHDVGKVKVDYKNAAYMDIMKHIDFGREMLLPEFGPRIANVALMHHYFQEDSFPEKFAADMSDRDNPNRLNSRDWEVAEVVALCDKVEAYMTRSHRPTRDAINAACHEYQFNRRYVQALREVLGVGQP